MAMTALEINTAARQRYNAVGDDFWSDAEMYLLIYQACCQMAANGLVIEQTFSTTSVTGQQEYTFPTTAVDIKRVTYDGRKLFPIDFRDDDVLTALNQATTSTGTPSSYAVWNRILYLRDIPGSSGLVIKIFCNIAPSSVTSTTTLEIPTIFEMAPVFFMLSEMSAKNKNYSGASYYRDLWRQEIIEIRKFIRKTKISDAFNLVRNVDITIQSDLGKI
jgi:hypothetical protein